MQINNINKSLKDYVYKDNYDIGNESNNDLLIKKNYFDELFTNVDSGKALIANAFGNPLSKEQSFIDIANNMNSLLETFQSNMRDKNISVSGNEKFEQLIEKIPLIAINEDDNSNDNNNSDGSVEVTATAEDVIEGKTFINSANQVIEGTMPNQGALSVTPGTTTQSFPGGNYNWISVTGDSELLPENIVQGKNLFGVRGTATVASLGGARMLEGIGEVPPDTDLGSAPIEVGVTNINVITGFVTILELDVAGIRYKNLTFKLGTEATITSNGYTVKFIPRIVSASGTIVFSVLQNNNQTGIFGDIHYTLLY